MKKLLPTFHFQLPAPKGQTTIEFIIIWVISVALIFGVMDVARLSWTSFFLHDAAFCAARAVAVNKSDLLAANYVTNATLKGACLVSTNKSQKIPSNNPPGTYSPLAKGALEIYALKSMVTFAYRPLFASGKFWSTSPWKALVPIRVSSRMEKEIPNPLPKSRN